MKKSPVRSEYHPDKWLLLRINSDEGSHYRVFASWIGGYTKGDSWKLNSGIVRVEETDIAFYFHGSSGSVYCCDKFNYGTSMYSNSVLALMIKQAKDEQGIDIDIIAESELAKIKWSEVC